MKRNIIYGSPILAIAAIISFFLSNLLLTGIFLVLSLVFLAIGFQAFPKLKGFSFTVWIFASVAASMFFPSYFTEVGDFKTSKLIVPLLMIIMFGMGTEMSVKDFINVVKMPKGVLIGLLCQFSIMPVVGFGLAYFFQFSPEIAAGIILVGCSPSGLASNVMAYLAKANLALSLTLTAVATLLAPLVTPFLMTLFADQLVPIDFVSMMQSILKIVIVPIIFGLLFNHFLSKRFTILSKIMPLVSMIGIAVIISVITANGRDSLLDIGILLVVAAFIHNVLGYFLGFYLSRLLGMDIKSARTIAFEVGMQNSGLASGIAQQMGRLATMGLAPAIFGPLMNITGSSLATWWRSKDAKE